MQSHIVICVCREVIGWLHALTTFVLVLFWSCGLSLPERWRRFTCHAFTWSIYLLTTLHSTFLSLLNSSLLITARRAHVTRYLLYIYIYLLQEWLTAHVQLAKFIKLISSYLISRQLMRNESSCSEHFLWVLWRITNGLKKSFPDRVHSLLRRTNHRIILSVLQLNERAAQSNSLTCVSVIALQLVLILTKTTTQKNLCCVERKQLSMQLAQLKHNPMLQR